MLKDYKNENLLQVKIKVKVNHEAIFRDKNALKLFFNETFASRLVKIRTYKLIRNSEILSGPKSA